MCHDTLDLHSPSMDVENIDAAINVAYGFGSSPLAIRTIIFNFSSLYIFIVDIVTFNTS